MSDQNDSDPTLTSEQGAEGPVQEEQQKEQHDPLEQAKQELAQLKDQLLRTAADFDNFRKRTRKDIEEIRKKVKEDTLRELFPIFDNLERALTAAGQATDIKPLIDGVSMVLKLYEDTAGRMGLSRIKAVGERFDPNLHEAIQQVASTNQPAGTIITELVPGYTLDGRLVRAALVTVATAPAEEAETNPIQDKADKN